MRDQFIRTLTDLAKEDPELVLLTGDLGFGVLDDFARAYPEQFVNVGVAEQNMAGIAAGLALAGRKVFTYSIGNFPTLRCLEQLRNDICHHHLPVATVAVGAGFSYGPLGFSHHATEELAALRALPELSILVPSTDEEVDVLTRAFVDLGAPSYLRLDRDAPQLPNRWDRAPMVEYGKLRVRQTGEDVVLIALGSILGEVAEAAQLLERAGIASTVASCHTLKPFDSVGLAEISSNASLLVTVEEHAKIGGLGSAVAETLAESGQRPRLKRIGLPEAYRPSIVGSQRYLRSHFGLDSAAIAHATAAALMGNAAS